MNLPVISVTVPIYNTSKYLKKCLDSLCEQTLQSVEFILVDDGSTDNCRIICHEYAEKDSRFRVISQNNGGLAAARQTGLNAAQGEYVIVCDSDDWVEPYMYENLYNKAKETDADIVTCGYFAEYSNGKSVPIQYLFEEKKGIVDNNDFLRNGAGSSWIKLIRKSLFEKAKASYTLGINLGEDALIIYKLMKVNPKIVQIKDKLYHYRRLYGMQSYTNNVKMNNLRQLQYTYNWVKDNYSSVEYESIRFNRAIDIAFAALRTKDLDIGYLRDFLSKELPLSRFFANKKSAKSIIVLAEKLISIKLAQLILKLIYRYIYK